MGRLLMATAVWVFWGKGERAMAVLVKLTREYQLTNGMVNILLRTCMRVSG